MDGGLALIGGFFLGVASIILGLNGWDAARLWLYMLASAMLTLTGIQLLIYWIQFRVLDELNQRESLVEQAMVNSEQVQHE